LRPSSSIKRKLFRTILANGLTVLVQPLAHLASVSVGLCVTTGSRDETPSETGMSHLVEHMLFQGTRRRDTRELARVISAVGGNLDACTGRESTAYYAKVPARFFRLAMDVLSDMIMNSRFTSAHLQKEKQIIFEEIRMYEDTPDELVHDLLFQAFWPRHALGRSILGTRKNLLAIKRRDLLAFTRSHYQPGRMILAVAGNVSPEEVVKSAIHYFGSMSSFDAEQTSAAVAPKPVFNQIIRSRDLEQVHVCLGILGLPFSDQRRIYALALSNVLGGGTNSRLFFEVREKRALVYTIYSFMDFYRDTGIGGVYFACHPGKVKETLKIVQAELYRISTQLITDRELKDVREQMRGSYLISLESSSTHMWNMIHQEMYLKKHPDQATILETIARIRKSDIRKLAQSMFLNVPIAVAAIGTITPSVCKDLQMFKLSI